MFEEAVDGKRIDDYFRSSFFKTNFWYLFASMFGFEPWHSLMECRRYLRRFFARAPISRSLIGGWNTPYNNYESIVLPIERWLSKQKVDIQTGARVTDVDFRPSKTRKSVEKLHLLKNGNSAEIAVAPSDFVFITIGSKVAVHDGEHEQGSGPGDRQDGRRLDALGKNGKKGARLGKP